MRNRISKDEAAARGLPLMLESLAEYERLGDRHGMALALENLGTLTAWLGDPVGAMRYQEQSLDIRRALGDKPGIAVSARFLSRLALRTGDCGTARGLTEECLAIERELGKPADEAEALAFMAEVSVAEENYDEARALLEESLRLFRHREDAAFPPWLLGALGQVATAQRDFSAARVTLEEQVERSLRLEQPGPLAGARARLSLIALAQGRTADAAALAAEVLSDPKARESKWVLAMLGETLAGLTPDPLTAVRLLAASAALRRGFDPPSVRPHLVAEYHQTLASGRDVLGDEAFGAAWAAGESLTQDELADALDGVVQGVGSPPMPSG
jgi:tetratricopeptide (TPR) repeat protein